jgi:GGDEF domain-containing protein
VTTNLADLIKDPVTVDPSFQEFLSENDFLRDMEATLSTIKEQSVTDADPQEISFIAIEIDDQERIANSYGDQTLRNLSRTVGQRIRDLLPALFMNYTDCKLYYIYGCRFYLFLRGFSLEKTKSNAERLHKTLESRILVKQSDLPGGTLALPKMSAHLGVTWYPYEKLKEFFEESQDRSIADISSTFYHSLDFILKLGASEGGNVVFAWDPDTRTYAPYQAGEEKN